MENSSNPKRRRRQFKSCLFCRQRKLKCDHNKPICQQCKKRSFTKCLYTESFNYDITADELFEKYPNVQLVEQVTKLQTKLGNKDPAVDKDIAKLKFLGRQYIDHNEMHVYGYSSIECITNFDQNFLQKTYSDTRDSIMTIYNEGTRSEVAYLKEKNHSMDEINPIPENLLTDVCEDLPSYEEIKLCLTDFFNSSLHDLLDVVDKTTTFNTFNDYFIINPDSENNLGRKVSNIIIPNDNNIFKIAIVIFIIATSPHTKYVRPSIRSFLEGITEFPFLTHNKHFEYCQLLVLRYTCISYDNTLNASDKMYRKRLVHELCRSCIDLGLTDADLFYSNMNYSDSQLVCIKKVFYWALLLDVHTALEFGTPVQISDEYLNVNVVFDVNIAVCGTDVNKRRNTILKEFLKIMRSILNQFNQKRGMPQCNISNQIGAIKNFIETKLLPMKFYTDLHGPVMTDPLDLIILGTLLEMLVVLSHAKKIYYNWLGSEIDKEIIKYSSLQILLNVRAIIAGHKVDKFAYPELFTNVEDETPHLHLSLRITQTFLKNAICHFYSSILNDFSSDTMSHDDNHHMTLLEINDSVIKIQKVFDMILTDEKLLHRIRKSEGFIISCILQTISSKYWMEIIHIQQELYSEKNDDIKDRNLTSNNEGKTAFLQSLSNWDDEEIMADILYMFR